MSKEIERKWLLRDDTETAKYIEDKIKNQQDSGKYKILQVYLSEPSDSLAVRARARERPSEVDMSNVTPENIADSEYTLNIKDKTNLFHREERHVFISRSEFVDLFYSGFARGRTRLQKIRTVFQIGNNLWVEVDTFIGDELHGLIIAEIEFDSEKEAEKFTAPEIFGDEVTGKEEYYNESLANNGLPSK